MRISKGTSLPNALIGLFWYLSNFGCVRGGQIFVWETLGAKSHMLAIDPLVRALAQRNHSVLYVSYNAPRWLNEEKNVEHVQAGVDVTAKLNEMDLFNWNPLNLSFPEELTAAKNQENCLKHPRIQQLLRERPHFDLSIISTSTFDIGLYMAKKIFKTPTIYFSAGFIDVLTHGAMGNPTNPAYVGNELIDVSSSMTFRDRLFNTLYLGFLHNFGKWELYKVEKELSKLFPEDQDIDLAELKSNTDLLFINQHPLFDKANPINPNTIMVGGIHISPELQPLPKDIKDWLDKAEHGAIYVSLGSVTIGSKLPSEKRQAMLKAFAGLKERVLWKWETENMTDKPDNVMLKKWCPQQEILAHPNVKLFVSHGGLLSTYESVYFGKPLFVIPGFADQFANAHFVKDRKIGTSTRWNELNDESFSELLYSVLNNAAVAQRAKEYSSIFRDELVKPLDKAVFYAEYLLRHNGAQHLQPSSKQLYWFQYLLIDVALFLLLIMSSLLALIWVSCKGILGRGKKNHEKKD